MGPLPQADYQNLLVSSDMYKKYKDSVDPESAFEMLNERMAQQEESKETTKANETKTKTSTRRQEKSTFE